MSGGGEDYKSYTPVVGRMKSKRWVQAANYNYEGDEWGDEYDDEYGYEEDEHKAPPIPQIPQQFLDQPVPLQLGTTGEKQKLERDNSDASDETKPVPPTIDEPAKDESHTLEHSQSFDKEEEISVKPTEPAVQPQAQPEEPHEAEHPKTEHEAEHPEPEHEAESTGVLHLKAEEAPVKYAEEDSPVSPAKAPVVPQLHVNEHAHEDENVGGQLSRGHSIVEDIYGYYGDTDESEGETYETKKEEAHAQPVELETKPEAPSNGSSPQTVHEEKAKEVPVTTTFGSATAPSTSEDKSVLPEPEKEISPPSSEGEWDETDDDSSFEKDKDESLERPVMPSSDYSFDKGSEDYSYTESIGHEKETEKEAEKEETEPEEEAPKPTRPEGRWKPLPESVVTSAAPVLKKERSQDRLEREILGSLEPSEDGSRTEITMVPPAPQFQRHELRSQPASRESFEQVDPEIRELYQNSHQFLQTNQPDYSETVEPLTTNKSDRGSVISAEDVQERNAATAAAAGIEEEDEEDLVAAREAAEAREARDEATQLEPTTTISSYNTTGSAAESPKSRSTSDGYQYKSMLIDEPMKKTTSITSSEGVAMSPMQSPISPVPSSTLSPVMSTSTTGASRSIPTYAPTTSIKPQYDFIAILSRGKTADRYNAFNDARQKEYEYATGLENWLAASKDIHRGGLVYTSGRPPPPTETEAKLAMPSRTMSSAIIRPAKHVVNSHVIDRIGEKSTKKAKGLFAKGKKLIS
ncbi:hypothetical protein TRVA0_104S00188 [Trichomonascus vanleenenianus]|uniref:uncharacterized protein n=1 Tax=Trichomonascus vanleenenianus TaxID=2268995 RepID=UPI003ECB3964